MTGLERFGDAHGAATLGWVEAKVLYSRFERTISCELGTRFAHRLSALIGDTAPVHYFSDSSAVVSYDLAAFAAIVDVMLDKRSQFKLIVSLPWVGALGARAQALPAAFGCMEYVTSRGEFEARFRAAAPLANLPTDALQTAGMPPPRVMTGPFTYVFDLSEFEAGRFVATRFAHLSVRPKGTWLCVARDDEQALAQARQAAIVEWVVPSTRDPRAFTVHFVAALRLLPCERTRRDQ